MTKNITLILFATMISFVSFADTLHKKSVQTSPSSNVAWTPEQLRSVAKGNIENGARLNKNLMCSSCHGVFGKAYTRNWPSLAGQRAEYTYKMLKDFQDGKRAQTRKAYMMSYLVAELTEHDMADLSQFYASIKLPSLIKQEKNKIATQLVKRGDGSRFIASCASCHGYKGQGSYNDLPALAGQTKEYFIKTMYEFKTNTRHNDIYSRMRLIANRLTDEEIVSLANYYTNSDTE